jgi:hypothetical protein
MRKAYRTPELQVKVCSGHRIADFGGVVQPEGEFLEEMNLL